MTALAAAADLLRAAGWTVLPPPGETRHHWQCNWHLDQGSECSCGLTGPRTWWMDLLPADRAPTPAELAAWRQAIDARDADPGAAHEPEPIEVRT